jgi:filamentous hemagglutinin family protein
MINFVQLKTARRPCPRQRLAASTALGGYMRIYGLAGAIALTVGATAHALPTGGVVAAGSATLSSTSTSLTVTQTSQNAVLNYQVFSIATGETVRFVQPDSTSVTLNRVIGSDPSVILGRLTSNGEVFLVNPNGVLFAKGAQVNVGALVASTLDISNTDFMAGAYKFSGASANTVLNQGAISAADSGYVALLGANVSNKGAIIANLGSVVLAGGRTVTLDVAADGLLNVTVDQGVVNALVANGGLIRADGGRVVMTTQAAGLLLHTVVNTTGVIEARSIGGKDGTISLLGDASGDVNVSGTLDASGAAAGQTGGAIVATGGAIALTAATLNASGDQGGGSILLGGGYQGKTATIADAATVSMASNVSLKADALTRGDGGQVVLWSRGETTALGSISAQGGALSGDGGSVETSGESVKTGVLTSINTLAPNGATGLWLLDPVNYVIATNGGDETPAQVTISLANSNRLITASNDITVSNAITWTTPQTLTLNAGNDVLVNAAITASTAGSEIDLVAGHNVEINGALTASGGGSRLDVYAGQDINQNQAVTASGGGAILFVADSDGTGGLTGGTVNLNPLFNVTSTSKTIYYSPPGGYGDPTLYTGFNSYMWVFVAANNKVYDGTDTATPTFRGDPTVAGTKDVSLTGGTIAFEDPNVGTAKAVDYNNYSLIGADKGLYALYPNQGAVLAAQTANAMITATAVASGVTTAAITPAPLTIQADDASKVYGQNLVLPGTAFTSAGLVNAETIGTVTETSPGAAATASVAGSTYAITANNAAGGSFKLSNYTVTYLTGDLTVTPAPLVITADNAVKTYGQTLAFAGTEFNSAGLVNGDTVGTVTLVSPGTPATASVAGSPYAIVPSNAVGGTFVASNYNIDYVNGALVIDPASLVVTADSTSKTYGQAIIYDGTEYVASGLQNGETTGTATLTSSGASPTADVAGGPYAVTASNLIGGTYTPANYAITYVAGALSVTPASLSVMANDATKPYGDTLNFSGAAFTAAGLQNGETIGTVTETSSGAAAAAASGPYAINVSNATGGTYTPANYVTTYVDGALIVAPPVIGAPIVGAPVIGAPIVGAPVIGAPVVGAPIVGPPVVGAPVVGAPVVGTPVVSSPVVTPPVVTTPAGATTVAATPINSSPDTAASGLTPAGVSTLAETINQTDQVQVENRIGAPLGMTLAVINQGVRMPAYSIAQASPVLLASTPFAVQSVHDEALTAPKVAYVAPFYPRKQDRN